ATAPLAVRRSANSGKSASVFHSLLPAEHALVCALARPSAIHLRTCSTGTGPYSLWSAPMILYIIVLGQSQNTNTQDEVAKNQDDHGHQAADAATNSLSFASASPLSINPIARSQPSPSDLTLPATNSAAAVLSKTASRFGPQSSF